MTSVRVVLTYEDYAALPNDGKRYEILDGELNVTPAPGRDTPARRLAARRGAGCHVATHRLGEVYIAPFDVILAETTIVQPDVIFVANDRLAIFSSEGRMALHARDRSALAVYDTHRRSTKLQLYARYACRISGSSIPNGV